MEKFFVSVFSVLIISPAFAADVKGLALDCTAQYKVHESRNYNIPAHHRVPEMHGTVEVKEVMDVYGKDCEKLKKFYGVSFQPGQILGKGEEIPAGGHCTGDNGHRIGQIFEEKVSQEFTYQKKNGELPLFPLVHEEYATLLGVSGKADAKALYGTPDLNTLSDTQKVKLVKDTLWVFDHGKQFGESSYLSYYQEHFLSLILDLEMKGEESLKEYISDLLLLFKNGSKLKSSLVTLEALTQVGGKLNHLLNVVGGTKWSTKLEILKRNPLLFHLQIIQFPFDGKHIPKLNSGEMEEFLAHALEVGKALKKVPQVHEAQVLLAQYKNAAGTIEYLQSKFELSAKALDLIKEIKAI